MITCERSAFIFMLFLDLFKLSCNVEILLPSNKSSPCQFARTSKTFAQKPDSLIRCALIDSWFGSIKHLVTTVEMMSSLSRL